MLIYKVIQLADMLFVWRNTVKRANNTESVQGDGADIMLGKNRVDVIRKINMTFSRMFAQFFPAFEVKKSHDLVFGQIRIGR